MVPPFRNSNSGGVYLRILETLSQIVPLLCSPERERSWRCNLVASYVNHVWLLWAPFQNPNYGGVSLRILETVSQIAPHWCSQERERSWRCNLAASYVNHVWLLWPPPSEFEFWRGPRQDLRNTFTNHPYLMLPRYLS